LIQRRNRSILGRPAPRAPAAMRNVVLDGKVECCAVCPRLAPGYDGDFSQAGHKFGSGLMTVATFVSETTTYYCLIQLAIGASDMQQRFRDLVKHSIIWQIALGLYWLALFVMTHIPSEMAALPGASTDKLVHVAAFALLAMMLATAWQLSAGPIGLRHLACAWLLLVLYGALDEWTQTFVDRQASLYDLLGDAVGALIGLAMFAALRGLVGARPHRADRGERVNQ
jgi:VanZ like family